MAEVRSLNSFLSIADKIADIIVLIAAVVAGLYTIGKPVLQAKGFFVKRDRAQFTKHFNEEFKRCAPEFGEQVKLLYEIRDLNVKQSSDISTLTTGIKNIQRQQIMMIYHANKHNRTMTEGERERLDELYRDYKKEGGNSFVDKYYGRMIQWQVVYEEE